MTILINFGDKFALKPDIKPHGIMLLAGTITMPTLERRKFDKFPHMQTRFFDPQLYMAQLDPHQSGQYCTVLASYPWFGASGIKKYESDLQKQSAWRKELRNRITEIWPQSPITPDKHRDLITDVVGDCVEFQVKLGCDAIILPSPLTHDPGTDYQDEIFWLDAGLNYINQCDIKLPVFVTVALTDSCVRYTDPGSNSLLNLILDVVSARKIDGVYLIIEQGGEAAEARQISNTRVLWSVLHMAYLLKNDCGLKVGVNFFGAYGLVLEAVGADFWASGWYKSRYRFRLADKISGGLAYPSFWSHPAAIDIHLEKDFDRIRIAGMLNDIAQKTPASAGLITAVSKGVSSNDVIDWKYGPSRVTASQEHYFYSIVEAEKLLSQIPEKDRLDYIENRWLLPATLYTKQIASVLGSTGKTKIDHVQSWLDALRRFRRDQNV